MSLIVSVHSFRGGTGKSNTTASLAVVLAQQGQRVAIVDTDIQSPGIHVPFGFDADGLQRTINDYLHGVCPITEVAVDVSDRIGPLAPGGQVLLVPASIKASEITRVLREGYDVGLLQEGFQSLLDDLAVDVLIIDTHPGLNEETLLSITLSDVLLLVLRPDQQDFQGTAVTVEIARRLEGPNMLLILNKLPSQMDEASARQQVESAYRVPLGACLPMDEAIAMNASSRPFVLTAPEHPWSQQVRQLAQRVLATP